MQRMSLKRKPRAIRPLPFRYDEVAMALSRSKRKQEDVTNRGGKYDEALSSLPEELRPIYTAMVDEYKFYALLRFGRAWVAYELIADLVRAGWRPANSSSQSQEG